MVSRNIEDDFELLYCNESSSLDSTDYSIIAFAATLASLTDAFLANGPDSPMSQFVKTQARKMKSRDLETKFKVPFDYSVNMKEMEYVKGLTPKTHRLQSLGHDPLLGFVFGTLDVMNGTFTTISTDGVFTVQPSSINVSKEPVPLLKAMWAVFGHLASDVGTSAGLPIPLMSLLQLIQVGSFGAKKETVAEVVNSMYRSGYNLNHLGSMTSTVFVVEATVRILSIMKRIGRGESISESIQSADRLTRMLVVVHGITITSNIARCLFTRNVCAFNLAQFTVFLDALYKWINLASSEEPPSLQDYRWGVVAIEQYLQDGIQDFVVKEIKNPSMMAQTWAYLEKSMDNTLDLLKDKNMMIL